MNYVGRDKAGDADVKKGHVLVSLGTKREWETLVWLRMKSSLYLTLTVTYVE